MDLLTEEQLDALRRELRDSQAAQNWSPGSTRSQWADDLANILDLHDRISIALDEAREKQARLTTKVAKRLAPADARRPRGRPAGRHPADPRTGRGDTRAGHYRIEGWDRGSSSPRRGVRLRHDAGRSTLPGPGHVTVDLLDGEVEVRIP